MLRWRTTRSRSARNWWSAGEYVDEIPSAPEPLAIHLHPVATSGRELGFDEHGPSVSTPLGAHDRRRGATADEGVSRDAAERTEGGEVGDSLEEARLALPVVPLDDGESVGEAEVRRRVAAKVGEPEVGELHRLGEAHRHEHVPVGGVLRGDQERRLEVVDRLDGDLLTPGGSGSLDEVLRVEGHGKLGALELGVELL